MSEAVDSRPGTVESPAERPPLPPSATPRTSRPGLVASAVVLLVMLAIPLYLGDFWLSLGLFVMAAVVGAIGLNLLVGTTGQLSLAHAFFLAVGAYGYSYLAGSAGPVGGGIEVEGLGLPTALAAVLAVLAAGVCGLIFSPVSSRLRGIYLGVASLALVFLGQHLLFNAESITGGYYGRQAPVFSLFGFPFSNISDESYLAVLGVEFNRRERLWYLFLALTVLAFLAARNLQRGRPGRALQMIRDREVAASVLGVPVRRYKAAAFVVSSMYAGLAGVLLALAFGRPVPDYFDLRLSVAYLAMIVIGGLGSVTGAVIGAVFVTALPNLLTQYSGSIPLLRDAGPGSLFSGDTVAHYLYGAAIVLVVLLEPGGLAALGRRLSTRGGGPSAASPTASPAPPAEPPADGPGRDLRPEEKA